MTTGLPLSLSWLWGNRDLSDVKLVIRAPEAEDGASGRSSEQQSEVVIDAHSAVLGSGSEFLRTKITSWRSTSTGGSSEEAAGSAEPAAKRTRRKSNPLAAEPRSAGVTADARGPDTRCLVALDLDHNDELAAVQEAIRFMYFLDLSQEAKGQASRLLQVCQVADQYLMQGCMKACITALQQLPPCQVDAHSLRQLLEHPELYKPELGFDQVLDQCYRLIIRQLKRQPPQEDGELEQRFLVLFDNVVHIIKSEWLCKVFQKVPFPWVSFWAASDDLHTDSENSVVLLVHMWMRGEQGRLATKAQLQEMSGHIRMWQVSFSYRHNVIPRLRWFCPKQLKDFGRVPPSTYLSESRIQFLVTSLGIPEAWLSTSPRTHNSDPGTVTWEVCQETMAQNLAQARSGAQGVKITCPERCYHRGWSLSQSLEFVTSGDGCSVGTFVVATPSTPWSSENLPVEEPCCLAASLEFACKRTGEDDWHVTEMYRSPMLMGKSKGYPSFLTLEDQPAACIADLDAFNDNGKFKFKITVTKID